MGILNFLNTVKVFNIDVVKDNVILSGASELVKNIIEFFSNSLGGYIALGIIVFTLILKIIPLPFDIYSRVATKKNALKMERMRPELEKLQRQYANNKELYSQKMMALYKKEGYSAFATCLPTLITLIFFIIVISAFTQYSTYSKINNFNQMAVAYSESVHNNEYVESKVLKVDDNGNVIANEYDETIVVPEYGSDEYKAISYRIVYVTSLSGDVNDDKSEYYIKIVKPAQDAAADVYLQNTEKQSFLWVKNIWIEDLPWKKAFLSQDLYASAFTYSEGCSCDQKSISSSISSASEYELLMGSDKLNDLKSAPNGYLILVLLSIGSMLLSQLIMTKSQKAQLELQTVDQTAQQSSKMMLWMMPIMFGVFSFMYTASFSLYLIVSTLFSTLSTVVINKIVEKKFNKEIEKLEEEKYNKRYGYLNKK